MKEGATEPGLMRRNFQGNKIEVQGPCQKGQCAQRLTFYEGAIV